MNSFSEFRPVTYTNHYRGPYNDRKLGSVSFVEFGDKDTAKQFVKAFQDSGIQLQSGGKDLGVKAARTQKNSRRNWALRKALDTLKATPQGREATLDWKARAVTVKGEPAFQQGKDNLGTFCGNYTHLSLP